MWKIKKAMKKLWLYLLIDNLEINCFVVLKTTSYASGQNGFSYEQKKSYDKIKATNNCKTKYHKR